MHLSKNNNHVKVIQVPKKMTHYNLFKKTIASILFKNKLLMTTAKFMTVALPAKITI